ncbi:acyl-CoA N-acyltransferase [Roridomyces roridus]|uniref:Acyl-CoA N-acyltransferase n=1 Tax=Roridomyces roridus TaxID=1738132 RepID=A0AAD7FVL9_9AGAR|nr:acyl-CoA N-acyltransferase [Roridomyces roridus]
MSTKFTIPEAGLESSRIQLTLYHPPTHNAEFFTQLSAHPILARWLPFNFTPEIIEGILAEPACLFFAIIDKPTGRHAGVIGLLHTSFQHLKTEIGPVICFPEFQRTHVTPHATALLLRYCLDLPKDGGLGFRRVEWSANPLNVGSVKAAERIGMKKEGTLRWTFIIPPGREGTEAGEGRGEGLGRDSVLLAACWDDWENGGRELVAKVLERE